MSNGKAVLLGSIPLLLAGCADVTVRKDFTQNALERVAFEMKCPKEQIQLTGLNMPLDKVYMALGMAQVGVTGCGQRAVYVRSGGSWLLNSEAKPEGPAAPPVQAEAPKTPPM